MAWPGQCVPRDIKGDVFTISYNIFGKGVFVDSAHIRNLSALLTAGVPQQEQIDIDWAESGGVVTMTADNQNGVRIERDFFERNGRWEVEHVGFELPVRYHGSGHAKQMMRASVEAYDQLRIARIDVMASGTAGGYAWAKAGFVADDEAATKIVLLRMAQTLTPRAFNAIKAAVLGSVPGDLLFDVARISVAEAPHLGRDFLRGSSWAGHIDLTHATYRLRLANYLR